MQRRVPIARLDQAAQAPGGLGNTEVTERRTRYGENRILELPPSTWWPQLRNTARDPMLWFLGATALLFLWLGDLLEALTLLVAAIPLVAMDLYLHHRTSAATAGLASRLASRARVLRGGRQQTLPATELVPGDLVLVSAGEHVPADGVLVGGERLQVDESALTGEAYPVGKMPLVIPADGLSEVPVDVTHWALAGTRLLTGDATLRVVFTGAETLYGEIVRSASRGGHQRTPLQYAISNLMAVLLVAASILCLALAWVRYQQGFGLVDALLSAVTLAVAALPEEFPVVFTFFLGVGVFRLAQRQALVRRAVVVENIGRVSCICSDKTGTITAGQLALTHRYAADGLEEQDLLGLAALASRRETGDPMDLAVLAVASAPRAAQARLATFPFTEDRKRETSVWRLADGSCLAAAKGAPEVVLAMCELSPQLRAHWRERVAELASTGHKVIACASRRIECTAWSGGEADRGLVIAGLLAFEDPVRDGVQEAVQACRDGGIRVLMITGDHPATARAVATDIGLGGGSPVVMEADQLAAEPEELAQQLAGADVIARAVPAQKHGLVLALQAAGEMVAVTGDGVNDVPALQAADIGLAMGEHGTRSAREVASIVLLDDNFRTITRAIAEGRQLFRNLKLSFAYLLMIHIPLVLTAALIPLLGYPLLYLPIHIIWLELLIHPTAMLVFQALPASGRLAPLQRTVRPRFFSGREWLVIGAVGALLCLLIMAGYDRSLGVGREVEHARAMTMAMLSFTSAALVVTLGGMATRIARVMVVATAAIAMTLIQTPLLATRLHLKPLHADDLLLASGAAVAIACIAALIRLAPRPASAPDHD